MYLFILRETYLMYIVYLGENMNLKIVPVILCGGSGTRLWPISNENTPKQFVLVYPGINLFQMTLIRLSYLDIEFDTPVVVCGNEHIDKINRSFKEYKKYKKHMFKYKYNRFKKLKIIAEPSNKNTAPALAAACTKLNFDYYHNSENDKVIVVAIPCDQIMNKDTIQELRHSLSTAILYAKDNKSIVALGTKPNKLETGFGYIEKGSEVRTGTYHINSFIEKPTIRRAQEYIADNSYLWNSGIYVFSIHAYLSEFHKHEYASYSLINKSFALSKESISFFKGTKTIFLNDRWYNQIIDGNSIDFAIMEKCDKGVVVESLHEWYDIGSWDRLDNMLLKDKNDNSTIHPAKSKVNYIDAKSNTIFSYDKPMKIGVVGLNNIIVAISGDRLLIADKSRSNDIKKLANLMEEKNDLYN